MRRFLFVFLPLILLSFSASGQSKGAIQFFQRAQEAFRNGNTEQGWKYLNKSMHKGRDVYYQPYIYAGDQKFRNGKYSEAIAYYDEALDIKELSSIYLKKSIANKYLFQWEESIAQWENYLSVARLSKERREGAELELENLRFAKQQHEEYIASDFDYNIQKLSFSTEELEYFPTITGGDEHLIYTHRYISDSKPTDENLFEAALDGISKFGFPLEGNLNSRLNEGAACISPDGQFMVLTVCDRPDGAGSCDLYYSHWNPNYGWEIPKPLPGAINTGRWESQPSLGPDGRTIYFVRASNSMEADRNIFLSSKDEEGNWSKGQKLPKSINSSDRESCPFMHFDGKTLYFLSERSPSLGASDFFMSTRINDSTWSEPINLGFPFNSFGEEFSLVIDKSGQFGYLASDRDEAIVPSYDGLSALDLYRFDLPKHLQPEIRDNYDLVVVDSLALLPIGEASVQLFNVDGVQFFSGTSAKNTGMVRLMTDGGEVRLSVYHKGYLPYSGVISQLDYIARPLHGNKVATIKLIPIASGKTFALRNILFELDQSNLLPESEKELTALLRMLEDNLDLNATIIGHTDNQGGRGYNQRLSEARAAAVLSWLVEHGIQPTRLTSEGRGMDKPVASNDTEAGRALNRRTEVLLR
ncbi:MAG: OmpA family protein [Schleiferiaceae bacterium]|nr:OmpA family protein [Schleiferiaceae bacterium]